MRMLHRFRQARVNVKVLGLSLILIVVLGVSLVVARHIRRRILSQKDLSAGQAAEADEQWSEAFKHYAEYLGRNMDDIDILKKYAEAGLSIRPLDTNALFKAVAAYRRVLQLAPDDRPVYDKLARIYRVIGDWNELAYIAQKKLDLAPGDPQATLWLADALTGQGKQDEAREVLSEFIQSQEGQSEKHDEFIEACAKLSTLIYLKESVNAKFQALELLNKAVLYDPKSAEARLYRAIFYRNTAAPSGQDMSSQAPANLEVADELELNTSRAYLALALADLEAADELKPKTARLHLALGNEWMAMGKVDKAKQVLEAIQAIPETVLDEEYLYLDEWVCAKYTFAAELALRQQDAAQAISLTDTVLAALTDKQYRIRILASAVNTYLFAGETGKARQCLDEYIELNKTQQDYARANEQITSLQALVAEAEGRPHAVIDLLQPKVTSGQLWPVLWRVLAGAYSRTGRPKQAVEALTNHLHLYPKDIPMMLQLARQYNVLQQWEKALDILKRAESLDTDNLQVKLLRIESSIHLAAAEQQSARQEQLTILTEELAGLRDEHPENVDIRLLQVMIALRRDQLNLAEQILKQAIEACPNSLRAELQLAELYLGTQRLTEAIKVCQNACEQYGELARPWLSLALCHQLNQDADAARECLKQGLEEARDASEKRTLTLRLAQLEFQQGARGAGIALLNELAARDEQEIQARRLLLETREVHDDPKLAEGLISELRTAEGETGLFWRYHQALLWLRSDQWRAKQQDIRSLLQYCIDADSNWRSPALALIEMYNRLKDYSKAEDTCQEILAENPQAIEIAELLMIIYEQQGRFSDAEKTLQNVDAQSAFASRWQIRLALRRGEFSEAIDELRRRVTNNAQDADSLILLSRLVYRQAGDVEQAMAYLDAVEKADPNSTALAAARVAILSAEGRDQELWDVLNAHVARSRSFEAYHLRAQYADHNQEHTQAEQDFQKLTEFPGSQDQAYAYLSEYYVRQKQYVEAINALEERLKTAEKPDDGLQRRLMRLLLASPSTESRARGLVLFETLEKKYPDDIELIGIRVIQLLSRSTPEDLQNARSRLQRIVDLDPTNVDAHLLLVRLSVQEKDLQHAHSLVIRALGANRNNANDVRLMAMRARVELLLENREMAREIARLVLQQEPEDLEVLQNLFHIASVTQAASLLEETLALVESLIANGDTNESLYLLQNNILMAQNKDQIALTKLSSYCDSPAGRESRAAALELCFMYLNSDQLDLAEEMIERVAQLDPNSPGLVTAQVDWATRLHQSGQAERSRAVHESLLKRYPDHVRLMNNYAWLLQDHYHQYEDALELVNRALTLQPDYASLLGTRGVILSHMEGRLEEAKRDFAKLVEISASGSPLQARTLFKLGRVCAQLEEYNLAKLHLLTALEIDSERKVFTPEEKAEISALLKQ